jgi:hypothetical protein
MLRALGLLAIFQLCAFAQEPQNFTVKITIAGKGSVKLTPFVGTVPGETQTFLESGKTIVQQGSGVFVQFIPSPGYKVGSASDNGEAIRPRGTTPGSASYSFVIGEDHELAVKFIIDSPTGSFPLAFKDGAGIPIVDITGNYTGILPKKKNPYTMDVAMDDSGKVDAMGSVTGFVNDEGENKVEGSGAVKTKNGTPTTKGRAATSGMLDGVAVSGSGESKIPVEITTGMQGPQVEDVVVTGSGKEGDKRFSDSQTVVIPAQPANLDKNFGIALTLAEETNDNGKPIILASAILTLPNGERTKFAEKKAVYSLKNGYSINFLNGVKIDTNGDPIPNTKGKPTIDRKSTVAISKMLLERSNGSWVPTEGLLKYKFLGQKGQGDVVNFFPTDQ